MTDEVGDLLEDGEVGVGAEGHLYLARCSSVLVQHDSGKKAIGLRQDFKKWKGSGNMDVDGSGDCKTGDGGAPTRNSPVCERHFELDEVGVGSRKRFHFACTAGVSM